MLIAGLKRSASALPIAMKPISHFVPSGIRAQEPISLVSLPNRKSRCASRIWPQRGVVDVRNDSNARSVGWLDPLGVAGFPQRTGPYCG